MEKCDVYSVGMIIMMAYLGMSEKELNEKELNVYNIKETECNFKMS